MESKSNNNHRIKDISQDERPREKLERLGSDFLDNDELLALILRTGNQRENAVEMSNRLIKEYGMEKLSECSLKELQKIKGIGLAKACQIIALFEFNKRSNISKNHIIKKITCAKDVFDLFYEKLKDEKQEYFYVLILNTQNCIIDKQLISKGILDKTLIHPREVFRYVIKNAASKIILIHNHPDGDPTPSKNDLEITEELIKAGDLLGIKIIDHIIIGNKIMGKKEYWSWKED
ncbi:MAG: hypothetical protein BWK75_03655 [Candidatus Altiarchaeales archaeon A3]|nr:MAG: hypothetical protein BWK75_03655 [Candidatus Altiarchaeales archaeon A3]